MARTTKAELEARVAELEALVEAAGECSTCDYIEGGVFDAVRRELALMPDAVKAAPALAASALKLGERLDGKLLDLAPAPLHAELRNTLAAVRAYHVEAPKVPSAADALAQQRAKRREDAARRATAAGS
jgi:hypothetical protein